MTEALGMNNCQLVNDSVGQIQDQEEATGNFNDKKPLVHSSE